MEQMLSITDEDILYAEGILLEPSHSFDAERKDFIRDFRTLDLQAVPGSGKTTALLAKLLILERYMPFNDNEGILLLSHTNAAIDEIKERIGTYCPQLFQYPNFIGTIQSFVDTFLAIPFYANEFKTRPFRIDNETYYEQVENFYNSTPNRTLTNYLNRQRDGLAFLRSIRLSKKELKLVEYVNGTIEGFKLKNPDSPTYKALFNFKLRLLKKGYLHFDDGYTLANYQLVSCPKIKSILQKRFKYVFVDEMQDMDTHQYELLEKLFFDEGTSTSTYQRIGDCNQAIFNGFSKHETHIWDQRTPTLYINGSHRINHHLAPIVQNLALTANSISGLRKNNDGSLIDIKPHILLFDDNSIPQVIPTYAGIIQKLQEIGKIPTSSQNKFAAVAWRKEHSEIGKLGLSDYWNEYSVIGHKNKVDYQVLEDYLLFFDKEVKTLSAIRKNILNALLKILRLEGVFDQYNRIYSKRSLMSYLKDHSSSEYESFKLKLYQWSLSTIRGNIDEVYLSLQSFIPSFLFLFDKEIDTSIDFINNASSITPEQLEVIGQSNIYELNDIKIEIGTVHSVKGQTHTSRLYLETFFERGYGNYESERIRNQLLNIDINQTLGTSVTSKGKIRQTAKMTYVGFSRATHLLCIAVHKDRFNQHLTDIDINQWKILTVS